MKILLIEDHADTARSIRALIKSQIRDVEIEVAANIDAGLRIAKDWQADITILDPGLPGISREDAVARISEFPPPVIVVTGYQDNGELLKLAYRNGALGYFEKRSLNGNLVQSIHDNYLHYALYVRPRNDAERE
jgi:DNA-binding NarL/FixJ family response regulator